MPDQSTVDELVRQRDEALDVLVELLAAVNVATLNDPSKYRVANTVGGPALVARQVLQKYGRLAALEAAARTRYGETD